MFGYNSYMNDMNARAGFDVGYVASVLHPESQEAAVRIPEPFGRPSTTARITESINITTSVANGQLVFLWRPNSILSNINNPTTYYNDIATGGGNIININAYTTGSATAITTVGRTWTNVATWHRLVSASIVIKYIGRLDESAGMLSAALIPEVILSGTATNLQNLVRDGYFHYSGKAQEGIKCIYMPMDNADLEYKRTSVLFDPDTETNEKHLYYIIGWGLPKGLTVLSADCVYNVEYVPDMDHQDLVATGHASSSSVDSSLATLSQTAQKPGVVIGDANTTRNGLETLADMIGRNGGFVKSKDRQPYKQ